MFGASLYLRCLLVAAQAAACYGFAAGSLFSPMTSLSQLPQDDLHVLPPRVCSDIVCLDVPMHMVRAAAV
jgi:hypothetical protein